ncbi:MAG: S8 family serine peptidase [Planctomycetota bacterium]
MTRISNDLGSVIVSASFQDLTALRQELGLEVERTLPALEAIVCRTADPDALLARLREDPRVRSASPDHGFEITGECCGSSHHELDPRAIDRANERLARRYAALRALPRRGAPLIAVLDTGVDQAHPDLASLSDARSFVAEEAAGDPNGHGTAMASLAAARPGRDEHGHPHGLAGVAPGARVLSVRVADRHGFARLSQVADGICWAVDQGADVISLSLGARVPAPLLDAAVAYAEERGALIVAAAGNESTHVELFPAADPRVISVGCCTAQGDLAYSTALAPATSVLEAGVEELAALPNDRYAHVTGTSASAARVAGALALARAARPELSPAALRALVRGTAAAHFQDLALARAFPAGRLDPDALAAALRAPAPRLVLRDPLALPARARAGEAVLAEVTVENAGLVASAPVELALELAGEACAPLAVPALAPGARVVLRARPTLAAGPLGPVALRFALGAVGTGCELQRAELGVARARGLVVVAARRTADAGLALTAEVEGRGQEPAPAGALELELGGRALATRPLPALALGERARVELTVPGARLADLPAGVLALAARLSEGDEDAGDDAFRLDLKLRRPDEQRAAGLSTQYQQSGTLNVITDAPWRVGPGRGYVPLLLYVPEKGDLDPNSGVRLDEVVVTSRLVPGTVATGQVIFHDAFGGTTFAPPGTQVLDESGQPQLIGNALDARLFGHQPLYAPGRYAIVRLPRAGFAIDDVPSLDETRYLEVVVRWSAVRPFANALQVTQRGTRRKVLAVRFAAAPRPRLGQGAYFDAHVHTIAEWYQDDTFSLLAPKKAWGGPLPMLSEAAYAVGLIDAPGAVRDRVITTDHNVYYNDGDALRDRPLYGPTSALQSAGRSEWERMQDLFGITRGEEVAFSSATQVNALLNLPIGAHMLSYGGQHIAGPWHGGSDFARKAGDKDPDLELADLLYTLAKTGGAQNADAALYAAHPFAGSNYWTDEHVELAFERDPARRTDRTVKTAGEPGFLTKGLQLWNGEFGRHALPTSDIDFNDVDPWTNAKFQRGDRDWDASLQTGLIRWQTELEGLLSYELSGQKGRRFARKVFASAGTDAHGDFNVTEDRLATMIDLNATFSVDRSAFGRVLTYALSDLQPAGGDPAKRTFEAFLDGNSVLTDGPLLQMSLDAEDRFDGTRLQWGELRLEGRDQDGRIGGGGAFDGRGTALVRRGSTHARLRYRYSSSPEWGQVGRIALYRTSAGDVNPSVRRVSGKVALAPRGELPATQADTDLEKRLDPTREGVITAPSAIFAGAFTGTSAVQPEADDSRCYTNPIWCVPFDAEAVVGRVVTDQDGNGSIPAGELQVRFQFDASLQAGNYRVELKALDALGESSDETVGPIDVLVPASGSGWGDRNGVQDSVYELTNQRAIPVNLERFNGQVSFVVYFYDAPRDTFGNELNRIAFTFETPGVGTGGGSGPALPRAQTGSTAAPATAAPAPVASGGGGGGGCALSPENRSTASGGAISLCALLILAALLLARRAQEAQSREAQSRETRERGRVRS